MLDHLFDDALLRLPRATWSMAKSAQTADVAPVESEKTELLFLDDTTRTVRLGAVVPVAHVGHFL